MSVALILSVASFTDAWIETRQHVSCAYIIKSHLLQMRGLKLSPALVITLVFLSHLLQMRGLKPNLGGNNALYRSRIFYRCVD